MTIIARKTGDPRIDKLTPSLVSIGFDMPYSVSGVTEKNYHGTGLIVDTERGLVVVDRNTVPVAMGDVRITFNGTVEVPGKVVFVHPLHNLAIVSYDPRAIGDTPVRAASFRDKELEAGEDVWVVGERSDAKIMSQKTQVASLDVLSFPLSRTLRFRDSNIEAVSLVNPPGDFDGVLSDEKGDVLALWSSFAFETQHDLEQVNHGVPADRREPSDLLRRSRVRPAIPRGCAQARPAGYLGEALRAARSGAPPGAQH